MTINWNITKEEIDIIEKIVDRFLRKFPDFDKLDLMMDITATHCNECLLKLDELLVADDFNFNHDIVGIMKNINRETGKLENCFVPRFSK